MNEFRLLSVSKSRLTDCVASLHDPQAAGEASGGREHDGHHLQRSFPQEISVVLFFVFLWHAVIVFRLPLNSLTAVCLLVQRHTSRNPLCLHGGAGRVDEALQLCVSHRQLPQIHGLDDARQGETRRRHAAQKIKVDLLVLCG